MSLLNALSRPVSLASSLLLASALSASAAAPRIVAPIDEGRLTRLTGNVPMRARAQFDQGQTPASTQMTHMRLVLSRSAEQTAALRQFEFELMDKSSPNYHKWLTPQQFGKLYGPTDSDIATIQGWLESHGFTLEPLSPGRTNIAFSGSVAQVEEAFRTSIHSFQADGDAFISNTVDPSIPSALATVVSGLAHLNTIRPRAHHTVGQLGMYDAATKRLVPVSGAALGGIHPNLTSGSGTGDSPYSLYVVPGDAATIYNTPNSTFNANFASGTAYTGTGVTIGIGGDGFIEPSVVADYRSVFLGNSTQPTVTYSDSVTSTQDSDEAYLDMELSGGLAPGATIHYYASSDLVTAIQQAIDENTVDIFSLSFGECELDLGTSNNALLSSWWQQAFNEGMVITVSTGDNGSAACDATQDSNGQNIATASGGLAVSGFASTPYNVAVGGTDYYALPGAFPTYAPAPAAGFDQSSVFFRSATKYIPESTWNDSSQSNTTISANKPYTGLNSSGDPEANIVGGSGGKSDCSNSTVSGTCTSGYPKPTWQRGSGVPADGDRDLPDVSLLAGNGADSVSWLVCTNDSGKSGTITVTANCTTQADGSFYFFGFGGTSTSTPAFAGILALVQQKTGGRLGLASKELYDLYNGSHASAIFHDITVGNNSVSCATGTPDCAKNSAGNYFLTGYNTSTGYDLATGLGSVDVTQLITYWNSAVGSTASTVAVTPSAASITTAQSLTVAVAVTGAGGTPTGTVTLTSGSYTSAASALASGAYTFTIPAGKLATGADTLTVTYSGDSTYAAATGTAQVTVTAPPAPAVSLSPTSLTFPSTAVGTAAATQSVTLKNTGTAPLTVSGITLGGANASSFAQTSTCATVAAGDTCSITVTYTPTTFGSLSATLSIADNATGSPQTVALSGTATEAGAYALTASTPAAVAAGSSTTSTITATPSGGYTGVITLTCAITSAPTGAVDTPTCSGSTITVTGAAATGTVTIGTTAPQTLAQPAGIHKAEAKTKGLLGLGGAALAFALFLGIPARRRAWRSICGLLLFVGLLGALSGCGGGSPTVTQKDPGTTAGTYGVTVTGVDAASVKQTTTFTFTVN